MAEVPATEGKKEVSRPQDAFSALKNEVDRLFDSFSRPGSIFKHGFFDLEPFRGIASQVGMKTPVVNVAETDKAFEITAELPGISDKDVDVTLADGVLTVKGEKREEKEDKAKNYYLAERSYGSFQRSFRLPETADQNKIEAEVAKGVLTVTIAKKASAKPAEKAKKIKIKAGT
ncbi:MAG: Hsp20/alpha crystallin family protein [Alphaproteobacteria bacterium]|nr:Hsp20/alpha crystallin family protein [Alphaproteobacteria bacterium]